MADAQRVAFFDTDALPPDTLLVAAFEGEEGLSRLYRFDIDLISLKPDIDLAAVLEKPCHLRLKAPVQLGGSGKGTRTLRISGMPASIRQVRRDRECTRYRVCLVPRLWRASLNVATRVFLDETAADAIEKILKEHGLTSEDYEFRCKKGPKREFIVQYQESDLDFIQRWLSHEGVFYHFEPKDGGEKIVFVDSSAGYVPVEGRSGVPFRAGEGSDERSAVAAGEDWLDDPAIHSFEAERHVVPARVLLKDYNWRKPSEDLKVEEQVAPDGLGAVYFYADHYKDKKEGQALATARAEEIRCRQQLFFGTSNHKSFRPGAAFALEEHYRADLNAEYALTEVRHRGDQNAGLPTGGVGGGTYRNEFVCIPKTETFRALRTTPWPSIHGVTHGKIDSSGDGKYAEIDDQGRYKVVLPFDLSGKGGGKASRYIRMMQPYAGGGMGMHFPLHKGTEVLLAFLDGDPDRPIILGAVPNPETGSPVTGGNQTQCVIATGGGNQIVIEDSDGGQRMTLSSPTGNTVFSIGAPPG